MQRFLTARWQDLVMANYEVPPALLGRRLPRGTKLDLEDGRCRAPGDRRGPLGRHQRLLVHRGNLRPQPATNGRQVAGPRDQAGASHPA